MVFLISNNLERSLDFTGILHVRENCPSMRSANRRSWEATPSEIAEARTLCANCAPHETGK